MNENISWGKIAVLIVAIAGVVGLAFEMGKKSGEPINDPTSPNGSAMKNLSEKPSSPEVSMKSTQSDSGAPVIIYSEQVSEVETKNRAFPTVKLWKKVGDAISEELATVGKVGEYPNDFIVSPDRRILYVNLESKLQSIDLKTKTLKDIFIPKKGMYAMLFSPSGDHLFIWDQIYASEDTECYVHDFNLATQEDKILRHDNNCQIYNPVNWRSDNKIILGLPMGEGTALWSYDLSSNKIIKTPTDNGLGLLSQSGNVMEAYGAGISDICDDMSGSTRSGYEFIDPVTAESRGKIEDQKKPVSVIAFSPDDRQVLFSVDQRDTKNGDCKNIGSNVRYYTAPLSGVSKNEISRDEYVNLLKSWDVENVGAWNQYGSEDGRARAIMIDNKEIISSKNPLDVVAQYFQK